VYANLLSKYQSLSDKDPKDLARVGPDNIFKQVQDIIGVQIKGAEYTRDAVTQARNAVKDQLDIFIRMWDSVTRIKDVVVGGQSFTNPGKFEILGSVSKIMDPNTMSNPEEVAGVGGHGLIAQLAAMFAQTKGAVDRYNAGESPSQIANSMQSPIPDSAVVDAIKIVNQLIPFINNKRAQIIEQFKTALANPKTTFASNAFGGGITNRTPEQTLQTAPAMEVQNVPIPNRIPLGGALGVSGAPNLNLQLQGLGPNTTIGRMLQGGNNGL